MRLLYTAQARRDLHAMLQFTAENHPSALAGLNARLDHIEARIVQFPHSAPLLARSGHIRAVPFVRYPFRLFYRARPGRIEILRIVHSARTVTP